MIFYKSLLHIINILIPKLTFMKKQNCFYNLYNLSVLKITIICIFIVGVFLQSCVKDGDFDFKKLAKNQYSPTLAAPFVNSRLTLKDILKDTSGIIQVNSDNSLKLVYSTNNLYSVMAKDLIIIPDQSIQTDTTNIPLFPPIVGDSSYYSIVKPYSFAMPEAGQKVDSIYFKSAKLSLLIQSNINHSGKIDLTIPNIRNQSGTIFQIPIAYTYDTINNPTTYTIPKTLDLSGYTVFFDNSPGHTNELTFNYKHWIYGDHQPNIGGYYIHLNDTIKDIQFGKLFGYIGQYTFNLKDTTFFDVFTNNTLMDNLQINNVNVGIKYSNSYGVPVQVSVDKFQAYSNTNTVAVHDFPNPNPFTLNYPKVIPYQVGQTINGTIPTTGTVQSTDLANAINIAPKFIVYNVTGKTNPTGSTTEENFVLDTSKFTVGVNIEVPLEGKVGGFVVQDTIDFNFDKTDQIDQASFKVVTTNAFPLSADIQVYFANQISQPIDSLIVTGQQIIVSGIVDPITKKIISPSTRISDIVLSTSQILKLKYTKKLIIKAKLFSYNYPNQVIKIFNDNYIDVKLGVKAKFKVNL